MIRQRKTSVASTKMAGELAQAELPDAGRCNNTALRKAMRRVSQLYDEVLAPCGLRATQRSILIQIARTAGPTMTELAEALVLDRSALAHNLKPLERDRLVEIYADQHDGRVRRVRLSGAGQAKLRASADLWATAQQRFEHAFGVKEAQTLRNALRTISSSAFEEAFHGAPEK